MLFTTCNVTGNTANLKLAVNFYESIGFKIGNQWGDYYAQMEGPGIVIGLHPAKDKSLLGSGNISLGFNTEDIDACRLQLEESAIAFTLRKEDGGQFIHFKDPDGTKLYFIKPKRWSSNS